MYLLSIEVSSYKIDKISNSYPDTFIRVKFEEENRYQEISLANLIEEIGANKKLVTEIDLKTFEILHDELYNKIPGPLHWYSKSNLLRFHPKMIGVSAPAMLVLNNNFITIGGPSYLSSVGIYLNFDSVVEWWAIDARYYNVLCQKVMRDFGVDINSDK